MADPTDTGTTGPGDTPTVNKETEYWNAVKAREEAETAAIEKEAARIRAQMGIVAGTNAQTGSVTPGTDAAKPEAMLLAALAAKDAAQQIAQAVIDAPVTPAPDEILLVTSMDDLSTASYTLFDFQSKQITTLLNTANARLDQALARTSRGRRTFRFASPVTYLGAGLDLAAKLGNYFQTDYTFGPVSVTSPDNVMAFAVSDALKRKYCPPGSDKSQCHLVRLVIPKQVAPKDYPEFTADLAALAQLNQDVLLKAGEATARASSGDEGHAAELKAAATAAEAAGAAYKSLIDSLMAVPQAGEPLIERIWRQRVVKAKLDSPTTAILVLSDKPLGAYYTKKNLWTFLGGPPLFTMAGLTVSYALLDKDRSLLTSGTVALHEGYQSVRDVQNKFR
ncbi:hypothetical protein [Sphingomonas limnosediminicola]